MLSGSGIQIPGDRSGESHVTREPATLTCWSVMGLSRNCFVFPKVALMTWFLKFSSCGTKGGDWSMGVTEIGVNAR